MASAATMSSITTLSTPNNNDRLSMLLSQPFWEGLLQRQIEDTLMLISELPETMDEKIIIDFPAAKDGNDEKGRMAQKRFKIQHNQLDLFLHLEALVEQLSTEHKATLIQGLHPAMSVREREALKVVLERGFRRFVVPKPLEVRKTTAVVSAQQDRPRFVKGIEGGEGEGDGVWEIVEEGLGSSPQSDAAEQAKGIPPSSPTPIVGLDIATEPLVFPELTLEEMRLRAQELSAARLSQGIPAPAPSPSSTDASSITKMNSRRRRHEIANTLSLAAKKLQVKQCATSSGLGSPMYSPTLREGLQLIRSATSALREFTDVSPREVVVRPRAEIPEVKHEEAEESRVLLSPLMSEKEASPSEEVPSPSDAQIIAIPRATPSLPRKPLPTPAQDFDLVELPDCTPPPTPPPKKPLRFHEPPPVPPAFPVSSSPADPVRPRSDPSHQNIKPNRASTCPWPESFFTSPRNAPPPPQARSVSLPQPPKPPAAAPAPLVIRKAIDVQQTGSTTRPKTREAIIESSAEKRPGSISAARAGIDARVQRQQVDELTGRLPATRASVAGKWTSPVGLAATSPTSSVGTQSGLEKAAGGKMVGS